MTSATTSPNADPLGPAEGWDSSAAPSNATIYDVAARAGVSIATVSHALNRPGRVAEPTRRRVLAAADQLGFRPVRRGGKAKPGGGPKRIAAIGPLSLHDTYLPRLLGIARQAAADFIDVVTIDVAAVDNWGAEPHTLDRLPLRGRADGIIVMGAEPSAGLADNLQARGIATVLLDWASERFSNVQVDDDLGGRLVAKHLTDLGCKTFALVSPAPAKNDLVTSGERRFRGFTRALRQLGLRQEPSWVITQPGFEGGRAAARALADGDLPDAVFGLHDRVAAGLMAGFASMGLRVPDDVRVAGYDDVEFAGYFDLTTVSQPFLQSGVVAMQTLRAQIVDPERPLAHIMLQPALIVRGSTAGTRNDPQSPLGPNRSAPPAGSAAAKGPPAPPSPAAPDHLAADNPPPTPGPWARTQPDPDKDTTHG
ncbi:MAG: LacI family transcriptional regulator [Bifidobacteriaceae bacterium]|jgi:LacI family transcriptional regulator|nr:LacI family transcriptional regulator [Bifidobacteriaceae bacterium]